MTSPVLPSWREGETRSAILDFLARVDEIPPDERVAVFDNDGTLLCEKPDYIQLEFFLAELEQATADNPALTDRAEYRAIQENDRSALAEIGLEGLFVALLDLFVDLTPEEFDGRVRNFFTTNVHQDRQVPLDQLRYQPMLEFLDELRRSGFDCYLSTGGGSEFVRVISHDFYGIGPEGVVGSQIDYAFRRDDAGQPILTRTNQIVASGPNEGTTKVPNIRRILGRRPVVAGGNSAGDTEMLEYAAAYDGPSLAILIDHDDADREYAYVSEAGTFDANEPILETADRLGWTVVSMKNDWATVFPG